MSAMLEDEYEEIERCLRQAQEEIGYALLSLSEKLQGAAVTQPVFSRIFSNRDGIDLQFSSTSCGSPETALQKPQQPVDFHAIFEEQPLEAQLKKLELQLLVPPSGNQENNTSHESSSAPKHRRRRKGHKSPKMEYDDEHGDSASEISSDFYTPPSGNDMEFMIPNFGIPSEIKTTVSSPLKSKPEFSYFPEELVVNVPEKKELDYIVSETASCTSREPTSPGVKVDSVVILDECSSPGIGSLANFPFIDDDQAEIEAYKEAKVLKNDPGESVQKRLSDPAPKRVSESMDIVLCSERLMPDLKPVVMHKNIMLDKSLESDSEVMFYSADESMDSSFDTKKIKPRPRPRRKKMSSSSQDYSSGSCSSQDGKRMSDSIIHDLRHEKRSSRTEAKRASLDLKLHTSNNLNQRLSDSVLCDKSTTTLEKNINHHSEKRNKEKILFENEIEGRRFEESQGAPQQRKPDISAVFAYIENQMPQPSPEDKTFSDDVFSEIAEFKLENIEVKENNLSPDSNLVSMVDVGIETEYCEDWRNSRSFKQRKLSPIIDEELPHEIHEHLGSLTDTDIAPHPVAPPRKHKRYKSMREQRRRTEPDGTGWRFQSLREPRKTTPQDENENTLQDFEKYISKNTIAALSSLNRPQAPEMFPAKPPTGAPPVPEKEPEKLPKKKESRLTVWQKRLRKRSAPPSLLFFRRRKDSEKSKESKVEETVPLLDQSELSRKSSMSEVTSQSQSSIEEIPILPSSPKVPGAKPPPESYLVLRKNSVPETFKPNIPKKRGSLPAVSTDAHHPLLTPPALRKENYSAMHTMTLHEGSEPATPKTESKFERLKKRLRKRSAPPSLLLFRRKSTHDKPQIAKDDLTIPESAEEDDGSSSSGITPLLRRAFTHKNQNTGSNNTKQRQSVSTYETEVDLPYHIRKRHRNRCTEINSSHLPKSPPAHVDIMEFKPNQPDVIAQTLPIRLHRRAEKNVDHAHSDDGGISAYQHIETARMAYAIASAEQMQSYPHHSSEPQMPAVSSPTSQRPPGLIPPGSHPGTLLDAMHRKFYSHQYEKRDPVIKLGVRASRCRRRSPCKTASSATDSESLSSENSPAYVNTNKTRFDFGIHLDRPPGYIQDSNVTNNARRPSIESAASSSTTDQPVSPESDTMSVSSFVALHARRRRSSVDSSDTTSINSVASSSSIRSTSTTSSVASHQESGSSSGRAGECNLKLVKHKAIKIPSLADPFESCKLEPETAEEIKEKSMSQTSQSSQSTLCSHGSQVFQGLNRTESTSTVGDAQIEGNDVDDMQYTKSLDRRSSRKKVDYDTRSLPNRSSRKKKNEDSLSWRSDQDIPELEAIEACKWLRAAGFPQYAQMYEDQLFPIDIQAVEKDHDFLDEDSIQSLFRRLNTLNKCASMKIDTTSRKTVDESDEEDQCALSDRWKFQRSNRRWSRRDMDEDGSLLSVPMGSSPRKQEMASCSSHDSVITDNSNSSHAEESPLLSPKDQQLDFKESLMLPSPDSECYDAANANTWTSPRLRRAASEKLKSAKNFLKRMDTLNRSKRRKKAANREDISAPKVVDSAEMKDRIDRLQCIDIQVTSDTSPTSSESNKNFRAFSDVDNSPESEICGFRTRNLDLLNSSFSDTEEGIHGHYMRHRRNLSDQGVANSELVNVQPEYVPGTFPKVLAGGYINTGHGSMINYRTGSFNLGSDSAEREEFVTNVQRRVKSERRSNSANRASLYDNVPEGGNPHHELDQVLNELFQNINSLPNYQDNEDFLSTDTAKSDSSLHLSEGYSLDSMKSDTLKADSTSQSETDGNASAAESVGAVKMDIDTNDQSDRSHSESADHSGLKDESTDLDQSTGSSVFLDNPMSPASIGSELKHGDTSLSSTQDTSDPDDNERRSGRERRDSGVGSSLTRAPSDRRRPRIRWHSFQKSHRPSIGSRNLQISNLSAGQLMVLRKLSLLKLTAMMERYSPSNKSGWNWGMPKFIKRFRAPDYKDKNVFGVPVLVTLQRTLQPLPQCILYAMRYLRRTAPDAVGIFRKSGVRSRIQKLRNQIEANPHMTDFDNMSEYDVADLVKQYFREMPECLLTNKLSETFVSIYTFVPPEMRSEACTAAIMLMPDENREVLQSLLLFLSDLAEHADTNQMNASNLAVCFAPSLFNVLRSSCSNGNGTSPRRNRRTTGIPDQKELLEQKATHECLTHMIKDCKKLFMIPEDTIAKCKFSYIERGDPVTLDQLCKGGSTEGKPSYMAYIETCIQGILKESRDKFKGWVSVAPHNGVDLAYKKLGDGHPLRLWKCAVEVEAPPVEVLNRILRERHLWDDDLLKWRVIERLNKSTEIFQYVSNSMAPHPTRDYCTLRAWKTGLPKGACVLVSTSIEHPEAPVLGGARGVVLASRFLIEPCGSGKSKVTHIGRTDTRGRTPDWYNKAFGQTSATLVSRIRESFKHGAVSEGPETKV